jgi:hypothetical protein
LFCYIVAAIGDRPNRPADTAIIPQEVTQAVWMSVVLEILPYFNGSSTATRFDKQQAVPYDVFKKEAVHARSWH